MMCYSTIFIGGNAGPSFRPISLLPTNLASGLDIGSNSNLQLLIPRSRLFQVVLLFSGALTFLLGLEYIATCLSFMSRRQSLEAVRVPPIILYVIPFLGSALSLVLNPASFTSKTR